MRKSNKITLLTGLLSCLLVSSSAFAGTLIIDDGYNVTGSGSGFALGSGINSGINPPTTRLAGTAAPGLRYVKTSGNRADSTITITSSKLDVTRDGSETVTLTLSSGGGAYDFSTALGTLAATPDDKAVYDVTIKMRNRGGGGGTARFSFAIGSSSGTAGAWDFGLQVYRANSANNYYTIQKRISAGACGGTAINSAITTTAAGTWNTEVAFLIRVTDAGAESAAFNSRVQVSMDNGTNWFYDTDNDSELPSKWRIPGTGRYFMWDVAGTSATFDDFSVNWISGPPLPPPSVERI